MSMQLAVEKEPNYPFQTGAQGFKSFDPFNQLYPTEQKPNRIWHSRNYHERIEGITMMASQELEMRTLVQNTSALTMAWPKMKLAEGRRVLEGSTQTYNIVPFADVPQRGTVRFMSEQAKKYSLAISQKGIGARIHGSVLDSPMGPSELERHIDAFAESLSVTMNLNTAIGLPAAGFRNALENRGQASFAANYSQKIASDLQVYGAMGAHPGRLTQLVEKEIRAMPEFDTVFLPDGSESHMSGGMVSVKVAIPIYTWQDGRFIELESKQTIDSLGSMKNGRVVIFEMPIFSLYARNRTLQTLESEVVIGEVYSDNNVQHYGKHERNVFTPANEDIYIYDQPADNLSKIRFREGIRTSYIWDNTTSNYNSTLINYVGKINSGKISTQTLAGGKIPLQYPVGLKKMTDKDGNDRTAAYLPEHIGNLSDEHLSDTMLQEMIESGIGALTFDSSRSLFADATGDMDALERLRQMIEDLPYDADSFEKIAAANIQRSAVVDSSGNLQFKGEHTPGNRILNREKMDVLMEWTPNSHGGLDIPANAAPVGYFSAAGIRTLSYTKGHAYHQEASMAYIFLQQLMKRIREVFADTAYTNANFIMPNLHRDDPTQTLLDAMYGYRLPLFLAAPAALIREKNTETVAFAQQDGVEIRTTGNPKDGLVRVSRDTRLFESPTGLLVAVKEELLKAADPATGLGIDTFLTNNKNLFETNALEQLREANTPQITSSISLLQRNLVLKLLNGPTNDQRKWIEAYAGVLVRGLENRDQFPEAVQAIFATTPTKKSAPQWKKAFVDYQDAGKTAGIKFEPIIAAVALLNRNQRYSSLPPADKTRVDEASRDYEIVVETAENAIQMLGEQGKFYFSTDGNINVPGRKNLNELIERRINDVNTTDDQQRNFQTLRETLIRSLGNLSGSEDETGLGFKVVNRDSPAAQDATVLDLARARYYRAPLNATLRIVTDIREIDYPWVKPADPEESFNAPVQAVTAKLLGSRYLINTQSDAMSRAGNGDEDTDLWFDYLATVNPTVANDVGNTGRMHGRMLAVRKFYPDNVVKRIIGISILMMPHNNIDAIENMVSSGVVPPFSMLYWRIQSKGLFGDILVMKRGHSSGLNIWNNARILAAIDNNRNDVQLRATIDTDAHVIRPENHRLVGPAQPRGYIGGHNTDLVQGSGDLTDYAEEYRPSVISTIVPRGHIESRYYPISFVNMVPGLIDRQTGQALQANPERQFWSGADYYGNHVYGSYFKEDDLMRYESTTEGGMNVFDAHSTRRNHLAFRGYHVRFDSVSNYFSRAVVGNGHRADPRMNLPGARAYFNMESSVLENIQLLHDMHLT